MAVGFYFDMMRCTGCRACQVACKDKNRLDVGTIFRNAHNYSVGSFPSVQGYSYSASCNHCDAPACMASCPTGAIYKADDGTVLIDEEACNGTQACVKACPYGIPQYIEAKNVAGKCDSCYAIRMDGGQPACVAGCPSRALDFGDIEELKAKHGSGLVNEISILPSATTAPNILIKAKKAAAEAGFVEISW